MFPKSFLNSFEYSSKNLESPKSIKIILNFVKGYMMSIYLYVWKLFLNGSSLKSIIMFPGFISPWTILSSSNGRIDQSI